MAGLSYHRRHKEKMRHASDVFVRTKVASTEAPLWAQAISEAEYVKGGRGAVQCVRNACDSDIRGQKVNKATLFQ